MLSSLLLAWQFVDQLSAKAIQEKFAETFRRAERIRSIGRPGSIRIAKQGSVYEIFSKEVFTCFRDDDNGRYQVSGGPGTISVHFFDNGQLEAFFAYSDWSLPIGQQIPIDELEEYAKQAFVYISRLPAGDSVEVIRSKADDFVDRSKPMSAIKRFEAIRKTNGIAWGPGRWGSANVVDYTGEIAFVSGGRIFNQIENTSGVLSQPEGAHYAAMALLNIKKSECRQTSLVKIGEKYITGNAFLNGQYCEGFERINHIINNNLGVLAYEYRYGNRDSMANDRYGTVYDVIIDARTGDPLRIESIANLDFPAPSIASPLYLPLRKTNLMFREGKKTIKVEATLEKIRAIPKGTTLSSTMQIGKDYWKVERIGKKYVKIGNDWFALK
jgi:hypothetical protein